MVLRVNLEIKKEKNQKPKEQVVFFYLRHQAERILLLSLRPIKSPLRMVSHSYFLNSTHNLYSQMTNLVILDLHLLVINLAGFHFRIPLKNRRVLIGRSAALVTCNFFLLLQPFEPNSYNLKLVLTGISNRIIGLYTPTHNRV